MTCGPGKMHDATARMRTSVALIPNRSARPAHTPAMILLRWGRDSGVAMPLTVCANVRPIHQGLP